MASAGRAGYAMLKKWLEAISLDSSGPRLSNVSFAFCRREPWKGTVRPLTGRFLRHQAWGSLMSERTRPYRSCYQTRAPTHHRGLWELHWGGDKLVLASITIPREETKAMTLGLLLSISMAPFPQL